jgi:DNA-binding transcriptional MerR regulator
LTTGGAGSDYLTIGEVSRLCHVSVKTLRYYDAIGLLKPDLVSAANQYRYYSPASASKVSLIQYHKQLGFRLDEIKSLIQGADLDSLDAVLTRQTASIQTEIQTLERRLRAVGEWRQLLQRGGAVLSGASPDISVQAIPRQRLVKFRYELGEPGLSDYSQMFFQPAFVELCRRHRAFAYGPFVLNFADVDQRLGNAFRAVDCYTAILKEPGGSGGAEMVGEYEAVVAVHRGSYSSLGVSYRRAQAWAADRGIRLAGPCWERYLIDPWSTLVVDHYVTEILLPIQVAS